MNEQQIEINQQLQETIKRVRQQAKLSLREMAVITGISASSLSRFETGKLSPTCDDLIEIAKACGLGMGVSFYHVEGNHKVDLTPNELELLLMVRSGNWPRAIAWLSRFANRGG